MQSRCFYTVSTTLAPGDRLYSGQRQRSNMHGFPNAHYVPTQRLLIVMIHLFSVST